MTAKTTFKSAIHYGGATDSSGFLTRLLGRFRRSKSQNSISSTSTTKDGITTTTRTQGAGKQYPRRRDSESEPESFHTCDEGVMGNKHSGDDEAEEVEVEEVEEDVDDDTVSHISLGSDGDYHIPSGPSGASRKAKAHPKTESQSQSQSQYRPAPRAGTGNPHTFSRYTTSYNFNSGTSTSTRFTGNNTTFIGGKVYDTPARSVFSSASGTGPNVRNFNGYTGTYTEYHSVPGERVSVDLGSGGLFNSGLFNTGRNSIVIGGDYRTGVTRTERWGDSVVVTTSGGGDDVHVGYVPRRSSVIVDGRGNTIISGSGNVYATGNYVSRTARVSRY